MSRVSVVALSVIVLFFGVASRSLSQASKQLEGRAKSVATPQEKSWQQVDEINKETDKTKSRYQQAQQSSAAASTKSGYTVKKSTAGSGNAYRKPSPPKQKTKKK